MEITKREIIASVTILAVMLLIGFLISSKISESHMDSMEKYNKATKIDSSELFRYGMDTSIGNAFVYGSFKAVDPVTYPEIGGQYLSVEKVKERYTRHTRPVTHKVGKSTVTTIQVYYTWDKVSSERISAKKVNFCGVDFDYSQFDDLKNSYIKTIGESLGIRYKYYAHPPESKGTIFAYLSNGNIGGDKVGYFEGKTIDETMDSLDSNVLVYVFWILWIIITGAGIYGFYYLDNRWLEERLVKKWE